MKSKIFIVGLALAAFALSACKPEPLVIRMGTPFKDGSVLVGAGMQFIEFIEARTDGRITVEFSIGLDSEEAVNEKNHNGELDIQINGQRALEVYAPRYFFLNAPFVIRDYTHFKNVWDSELGAAARADVATNGSLEYLGIVYRGQRHTTSGRLISSPSDVAGLKLRLPNVATWIKVWEALGAKPVAVPLTELYDSLATGKAEASEGDLTQLISFKLYEVQKNLTLTNHLVQTGGMLINSTFYANLTDKDKVLIQNAASEACNWASAVMEQSEAALIQELQDKGMTVTQMDAAALRDAAKPAVEALFQSDWTVTSWDKVLAY